MKLPFWLWRPFSAFIMLQRREAILAWSIGAHTVGLLQIGLQSYDPQQVKVQSKMLILVRQCDKGVHAGLQSSNTAVTVSGQLIDG